MALAITIFGCGSGGGGAATKESISISSPYMTPNPAAIGQTMYFYFYVDSVSDPQKMKYFNWSKSDGTSGQFPIVVNSAWAAPGWLSVSGTAAAPAGTRTITVWVSMSDNAESQKIAITYTVQ